MATAGWKFQSYLLPFVGLVLFFTLQAAHATIEASGNNLDM